MSEIKACPFGRDRKTLLFYSIPDPPVMNGYVKYVISQIRWNDLHTHDIPPGFTKQMREYQAALRAAAFYREEIEEAKREGKAVIFIHQEEKSTSFCDKFFPAERVKKRKTYNKMGVPKKRR